MVKDHYEQRKKIWLYIGQTELRYKILLLVRDYSLHHELKLNHFYEEKPIK